MDRKKGGGKADVQKSTEKNINLVYILFYSVLQHSSLGRNLSNSGTSKWQPAACSLLLVSFVLVIYNMLFSNFEQI
jgi:hypothetical protein